MNSNAKYPLVLHESWLADGILKDVANNVNYTNPLVKKEFVGSSSTIRKKPILRILKFLKTTQSSGLTAILADSTHKVLALFPFQPTILNFEIQYKQRITYHTLNSLILIKKANLKFVTKPELACDYGINLEHEIDILVLEVLDLEIFQRDQVTLGVNIENSLQLIYYDKRYLNECGQNRYRRSEKVDEINQTILQSYDDIVSI